MRRVATGPGKGGRDADTGLDGEQYPWSKGGSGWEEGLPTVGEDTGPGRVVSPRRRGSGLQVVPGFGKEEGPFPRERTRVPG